MTPHPRRVVHCLTCMLVAIVAGIAWRFLPLHLPYFAWKYGGSALWAIAIYWLVATMLPSTRPARVAILAAAVALAVEYSRRIDTPAWIHFRHTIAGRLLIGNIFSLRNVIAYWIGITIAWQLDRTHTGCKG